MADTYEKLKDNGYGKRWLEENTEVYRKMQVVIGDQKYWHEKSTLSDRAFATMLSKNTAAELFAIGDALLERGDFDGMRRAQLCYRLALDKGGDARLWEERMKETARGWKATPWPEMARMISQEIERKKDSD
jgi:hypothetical protein